MTNKMVNIQMHLFVQHKRFHRNQDLLLLYNEEINENEIVFAIPPERHTQILN